MGNTENNQMGVAVVTQLNRLEWMIEDAKKRVAKATEKMLWRAQRATEESTAMLNGQPYSLSWMESAESDLRDAKEAKAEIEKLYEQRTMLEYFIKVQQ